MPRTFRKLTGWIAVAAMLFAQLAVAAYACPAVSPGKVPVTASAQAPCESMDMDQANLCRKHCHDAERSQGAPAPVVGFIPGFVVRLDVHIRSASTSPAPPPALFHATAPPLTIRNCCFRI